MLLEESRGNLPRGLDLSLILSAISHLLLLLIHGCCITVGAFLLSCLLHSADKTEGSAHA